jgi:putative spermidine/putrescine transport system permease protein
MRSEVSARPAWWLTAATVVALLFIHVPLILIIVYSFSADVSFQFPPSGYTTKWYGEAWGRTDMWAALWLSVKVASIATLVALVLGTMAAAALWKSRFFGKDYVSLLFILPIALPGIITGIALRSAFNILDIPFSIWTIMLGHATFCIVVVYNNVLARFRRVSGSMIEASMDLGADGFQTFRYVVLPQIGSALLAGGMLAFALSFDEVIVTVFTNGLENKTLPIWIFEQLFRPRERPVTNVAAVLVMAITLVPVIAAYYLTRDAEHTGGVGK